MLLVWVFVTPFFVKASHFVFVHHEHQHHHSSQKAEVTEYHRSCPICAFDFIEFIGNEPVVYSCNSEDIVDYYPHEPSDIAYIHYFYCFYLRGPPAFV